ncbi:MAG: hypothetical protein V1768_01930, partial [Patescibacteria group bacterium]
PHWNVVEKTDAPGAGPLSSAADRCPAPVSSVGKLEKCFKKIQLKIMPRQLKEMANKNTKVVINDKILKLHVNDRRDKYRKAFLNNLKAYFA